MIAAQLPPAIHELCAAFVRGLQAVLGEKLYGAYLYGALTFPEGGAGSDVDCHVVVREALSDEEKAGLRDLDAALGRDFAPAGADMDVWYILLADARQTAPPPHQLRPDLADGSWALHRAHMRAGRCVVLCGPEPRATFPAASWPELEAALWREHDWLKQHLTEYPDYAALQLCRLMYSLSTRQVVVSKRFCAAWAGASFPEWAPLIDGSLASYDRGHPAEDRALLAAQIEPFYNFALARLRAGP